MIFTFILSNSVFFVCAQEFNDMATNDTAYIDAADSAIVAGILLNEDTIALKNSMTKVPSFKPDPKRAVIYSAIFPGLGQIYNKKYWKLPLVYGGFMGFAYAISWNNKNYQDYSKAYIDFHHDRYILDKPDEWKGSWKELLPLNRDPNEALSSSSFENFLRNGTNYYRRYRDLSIILTAGWYFLCIADAYVDAQLFDFDITPDLSMRIEPIITPRIGNDSGLYGINCSIKF